MVHGARSPVTSHPELTHVRASLINGIHGWAAHRMRALTGESHSGNGVVRSTDQAHTLDFSIRKFT